jgi:hypothetical protein
MVTDPPLSASLVKKAADLKERADEQGTDLDPRPPDVVIIREIAEDAPSHEASGS